MSVISVPNRHEFPGNFTQRFVRFLEDMGKGMNDTESAISSSGSVESMVALLRAENEDRKKRVSNLEHQVCA